MITSLVGLITFWYLYSLATKQEGRDQLIKTGSVFLFVFAIFLI